jgi:hypothetical protein
MKRREFLKTSMAASALAGVASSTLSAATADAEGIMSREYYELRAYRLKAGADHELLDAYLEHAAIPAWNRLGAKTVGVFTENEPKDGPAVYVLIPYATPELAAQVTAKLNADPEVQKAAGPYLQTPQKEPAFDRLDSWLLLAFAGMPKLELPAYSRERKPRLFELRTYESHNELKALKKVEMFNSGEIDTMREVGLAPVFYGQALIGRDLPHLTYMLSAENREAHNKHWDAFRKHPVWIKLKDDPQYADTVSHITNRFLTPTSYSQI